MSRARAFPVVLHLLFLLSGAAALGYQLIWSKLFSISLGHETPAVLAIVCAFMIGMALGSASLDRFIPRDMRAGRWLAGLELAMGLWSMLLTFFAADINAFAVQLIGLAPSALKHWGIAFAVPALTLLPATLAMGASFPAMEKFRSAITSSNESVGSVYAANTVGATLGVLFTPYLLMPTLGLTKSSWALAVVNGLLALSIVCLMRGRSIVTDDATSKPLRAVFSGRRLSLTLFITGLLGLGYEVAGVRVLSQVLKNTIFTYAAVLAVFLVGTAAGAAAYHRWWRTREPAQLLSSLLCGTALACFAGMLFMTQTPALYQWARKIGDSRFDVLLAELLTAAAVLALPAFGMGATFSHLAQSARATRGRIGGAVALNTLGAAAAPAVFGVVLIPGVGTKWALLLVGFGYALLSPGMPRLKLVVACLLLGGIGLFAKLMILTLPPGARVTASQEGVMATVAVIDEENNRTLRVDNSFQMGGTGSADAEYRHAHLPLLLHPSPRRALFLGLGTGITFGAASLHLGLEADGVELLPEVLQAIPYFAPHNFSPAQQPSLKLHVADARRFVKAAEASYDVVVADLFHPYRDGAGNLYTREHFAAVRQRLSADGIFCQWLPLFQLDGATLRLITRTFQSEFPQCEAWLLRFNVDVPVMALVGGRTHLPWNTNQVEARLGDARLAAELKRLSLGDSLRLYGHLLADANDLRAFAGAGEINTDDNQRVTLMASRLPYQIGARRYDSLLALLSVARLKAANGLHLPLAEHGEFSRRLSNYWAARTIYLRGLVDDAEGERGQAVNAYVESARRSSDFTAGYAQCLTIATVLAPSNPDRARDILEQLIAAQPERPVARQMLDRLFPK